LSIPSPRSSVAESTLLSLTTARPRTGLVVVTARGEVDALTAPALGAALDAAADPPCPRRLVVDLDDVGFIGSRGLQWLLEFSERCERESIDLFVVSASRPVRRAMEVTGLDRALNLYDSSSALEIHFANRP
jgi:anti-sigma B factor antagonist